MKRATFFIVGIIVGIMISAYHKTEAAHPLEVKAMPDTLTEWQTLQLAIAMTESRCNPKAEGADGDYGLYQITSIYVQEANRLAGTEYSHEDAFDIGKSVAMFGIVQGHHNPDKSIDKAISLHNPNGNSINYPNKVKANILLIQRIEAARRAIIEQGL